MSGQLKNRNANLLSVRGNWKRFESVARLVGVCMWSCATCEEVLVRRRENGSGRREVDEGYLYVWESDTEHISSDVPETKS